MNPPTRSFGKYLLDDEIARGGMSRVYRARLRGLGGFEKQLVVKQVLPELAGDPRFVSMFVEEAKTVVQMSHPNIAPVYELGVVDGVYFLAMEYVEGATLSDILAEGPLPPELVAHLGAQICEALHYAHERFGVVHRDVTPRNVIVDAEGHARLLDFGIAAPASGGEDGGLFGTPGYLSPEQAAGELIGARSDVFSLGAVLFEALTARQAFFARNVDEAREVLSLDGPDFYPDDLVPQPMVEIVLGALAREPDARPASARELGRALRSWVASHVPEGVGPELGARVLKARKESLASVVADEPLLETPTKEVTTLATSRLFDELLESKIEPPEGVTARIEGRRSQAPTGDAEEARGHGPEIADAGSTDDEVRVRALGRPPSQVPRWALALMAALAGLVALYFAQTNQPLPEGEPERPDPVSTPPTVPDAGVELSDAGPAAPPDADLPDAARSPTPEPNPAVVRIDLTVNANPWARVRLDGRSLGVTPVRRHAIPVGRHHIVFENPERRLEQRFEARVGRDMTVVADMQNGIISLLNR